jgi:hypothetical protein
MVWGMENIKKLQAKGTAAENGMKKPHFWSFYLRVPFLGAAHIEVSTLYFKKPIFEINSWNNEIILDLPGIQTIITPWAKLRREKSSAAQALSENEKGTFYESGSFKNRSGRNASVSRCPAPSPEN